MKNSRYILLIGIAILVIFVGYFIFSKETNAPESISDTIIEGNVVEISVDGFSPNEIEIAVGETVSFVNIDSRSHWPASVVHPTHKEYPDNANGCRGTPFDSCQSLKQGDVFSFVFNHKGEWEYHDHLNLALRGKIIVK